MVNAMQTQYPCAHCCSIPPFDRVGPITITDPSVLCLGELGLSGGAGNE